MKLKRLFSFCLLCLVLSLGLSGCYLPLVKKEVTIPLLEKNETAVLGTALAKYRNAKTLDFNAKSSLEIEIKGKDLSFINKYNVGRLHSFLNRYSPNVLGIDNSGLAPETETIQPNIPQKITIDYDIEGVSDQNDLQNIKTKLKIKLTLKMEGMTLDAAFETISIADDVYIKLTSIPEPLSAFFDESGIEFKNSWWKFSQTDIEEIGNDLAIDKNNTKKLQDALSEEEQFNKDLKEALNKCQTLKWKERERDSVIDEKKHYNYLLEIDKSGLEKCAFSILDILNENSSDESETNDIEDFEKTLDKALTALTENQVKLEIDKKTLEPRRFDSRFVFNFDASSFSGENDKANIVFTLSGDIKDIDKAVSIEAPAEARSIKEIIEKQLSDSRNKARDTKRISDAKQMSTITALYQMENNECPKDMETINKESYTPFDYPAPADDSVCPLDADYRYHTDGEKCLIDFCLENQFGLAQPGWNSIDQEGNISSIVDQDKDGLSDEEEKKYGTDPNKPDTDGDGYNDGSEVRNAYNPKGSGKLE
jgi:hypothetical protein